jgi:acetylornithine deacetylase/succinyl-diaminopimelate desuccinylase-like protein
MCDQSPNATLTQKRTPHRKRPDARLGQCSGMSLEPVVYHRRVERDFARVEDDALRILDALCRQPSVSAEARALEETAALVDEFLIDAGFETRKLRVDGSPTAVYGEQRGRSEYTLLLYNHYDVQPVDPLDQWESPPFEPTTRDGKLYARGTADNKGELAVRLAVIRAIREKRHGLPIHIRWIIEGEEEVLSPQTRSCA